MVSARSLYTALYWNSLINCIRSTQIIWRTEEPVPLVPSGRPGQIRSICLHGKVGVPGVSLPYYTFQVHYAESLTNTSTTHRDPHVFHQKEWFTSSAMLHPADHIPGFYQWHPWVKCIPYDAEMNTLSLHSCILFLFDKSEAPWSPMIVSILSVQRSEPQNCSSAGSLRQILPSQIFSLLIFDNNLPLFCNSRPHPKWPKQAQILHIQSLNSQS